MWLLDDVESSGTVFGGVAPGIEVLADEGAIRRAVIGFEDDHRDNLIEDAGQFQRGLGAVNLR